MLYGMFTIGGFTLGAGDHIDIKMFHSGLLAFAFLACIALFVFVVFCASIKKAGWRRTIDYTLQRIERDGVMSKGGSWNQMQESNLPLNLILFSVSYFIGASLRFRGYTGLGLNNYGGLLCIMIACALWAGPSVYFWPGRRSFLNPRWIAHGVREDATVPFTTFPLSLLGILVIHGFRYKDILYFKFDSIPALSLFLFLSGVFVVSGQLIILRKHSIHEMSQKPDFAPGGLSIPYLMTSHVFEHFLDLIFIILFSGGFYYFIMWLSITLTGY